MSTRLPSSATAYAYASLNIIPVVSRGSPIPTDKVPATCDRAWMLIIFGGSCATRPPTTSRPHQTSSRFGPISAHWAAAPTVPFGFPLLYATSRTTLIHRATTLFTFLVLMVCEMSFRSAFGGCTPVANSRIARANSIENVCPRNDYRLDGVARTKGGAVNQRLPVQPSSLYTVRRVLSPDEILALRSATCLPRSPGTPACSHPPRSRYETSVPS